MSLDSRKTSPAVSPREAAQNIVAQTAEYLPLRVKLEDF